MVKKRHKDDLTCRVDIDKFYDACITSPDCIACKFLRQVKIEVIAKSADVISGGLFGLERSLYSHLYHAGMACLQQKPADVIDNLLQAKEFAQALYRKA